MQFYLVFLTFWLLTRQFFCFEFLLYLHLLIPVQLQKRYYQHFRLLLLFFHWLSKYPLLIFLYQMILVYRLFYTCQWNAFNPFISCKSFFTFCTPPSSSRSRSSLHSPWFQSLRLFRFRNKDISFCLDYLIY